MKKLLLLLSITVISSCGSEQCELGDKIAENKLPSDPIVWMPINSSITDESSNSFYPTLYEVELTNDQYGIQNNAVKFDTNDVPVREGSRDDLITFNHNELFNTQNITLSAWVNPIKNKLNSNEFYTIASRWEQSRSTSAIFRFLINGDGNLVFVHGDGNSKPERTIITSDKIMFGEWSHVTFTLQGNNYKFYINSQLVKEGVSTFLKQGTSNLDIGETVMSNGHWYFFNGKMDNFGMWSRALSQKEITNLYQY